MRRARLRPRLTVRAVRPVPAALAVHTVLPFAFSFEARVLLAPRRQYILRGIGSLDGRMRAASRRLRSLL